MGTNNKGRKRKAVMGKPLADPKEASRKVRAWLLKAHPEEKPMIGDFRKDVTFADVNRRMHKGEDFSDICECGESEQRIKVFEEMMQIYNTTYNYWYNLWLDVSRDDPFIKKALVALKKNKKLKHLFKKG